ncbi:MAG: hypothetical protein ACOX3T_02985 [Bdellovibrionota bacterium]
MTIISAPKTQANNMTPSAQQQNSHKNDLANTGLRTENNGEIFKQLMANQNAQTNAKKDSIVVRGQEANNTSKQDTQERANNQSTNIKETATRTEEPKENLEETYKYIATKTTTQTRDIYNIQVAEGTALCDYRGIEYKTDQNGNVNFSIPKNYKGTLYVKDKATGKILKDAQGKPYTIVIFNTRNAETTQEFTINHASNNQTTTNQTRSIEIQNPLNRTMQEQPSETKENLNKEDLSNIKITKSGDYQSNYGAFSSFRCELPNGVNVAIPIRTQNGTKLQIYKNGEFSLYHGSTATIFLVDQNGDKLKDDNGNELSCKFTNSHNPSDSLNFGASNIIKEEKEQENTNNIVGGNVAFQTITTNKTETYVERRRGLFGRARHSQPHTRNVQATTTSAAITLDEGVSVYFTQPTEAKENENSLSFNIDKPTTFCTIKDNEVQNVYTISPENKGKISETLGEEKKKAIDSYNKRLLPINDTKETILTAREYIKLKRNDENNITNISINTENYTNNLSLEDKNFVDTERNIVENIKLYADGNLSFTTQTLEDNKNKTFIHKIDANGTYTKEELKGNIFNAKVNVLEYSDLPNNNQEEAKEGNIQKITRTIRPDKETLNGDARKTLQFAKKNNTMPLFFVSVHGNLNYNTMTGRNSDWINIIASQAKEVGYDGPIVIQMQHCYSVVTRQEREAMSNLPAGSYLIKSQDNNLSYYNPNTPQSADGSTIPEAQNASTLSNIAYFATHVIASSNNITAAIVTKNKEVEIFAEKNPFQILSANGQLLCKSKSNDELPNFDENEARNILENSGVVQNRINFYISHSKFQFGAKLIKYANEQTDYPFSSILNN